MILSFKTRKCETNASASVVDGKLVLSLPDAVTPVVWQMDLAHAKASALEVHHNEEKNQHSLNLKTPKGEKIEVAVFADRTHAVEGLMAASGALENAHGQIRPGGSPEHGPGAAPAGTPQKRARNPKQTRGKLVTTALALVVLFIMFTIWSSVIPRPLGTGSVTQASNSVSTSPQESSGVPVSADAFLSSQ